MRTIATLFLMMGLAMTAGAQKREYIDNKDEIQRRAIAELEASMQPEGVLYKAVRKEGLTGVHRLQISLSDKGDIRSVQVLDRQGGDIRSQNRFKQLVHSARFSSFKTPKGKQYRIEHTFDLDALYDR